MVTIRPITNITNGKLYGLVAGYIVVGLWSLLWGVGVKALSWVVPFVVVTALCGVTAVNLLVRRTVNGKLILTFWVAPAVAVILFASISPLFPSKMGGISMVGDAGVGFFVFLLFDAVPLLLLSILSLKITVGYGTELAAADQNKEQKQARLKMRGSDG